MGFILRYKAFSSNNLLVIDFASRLFFMQLKKFLKICLTKVGDLSIMNP